MMVNFGYNWRAVETDPPAIEEGETKLFAVVNRRGLFFREILAAKMDGVIRWNAFTVGAELDTEYEFVGEDVPVLWADHIPLPDFDGGLIIRRAKDLGVIK